MSETEVAEERVKEVRREIFRLALQSPDLETMHWYTSLDECLENDELQVDQLATLRYRLQVLFHKKQPTTHLNLLVDALVKDAGYDLGDFETGF